MITIKEISDKSVWESFLGGQTISPFFQSWPWGEVQSRAGFPIFRLGLYKDDGLVGIAQIIHVHAKKGNFYHLRHGPILKVWNWQWFDDLLECLKNRAKTAGVDFIRFSPILPDDEKTHQAFNVRGFRNSPIHNMDGECAWVLDIAEKTEDELLLGMRKTTRYLIRKANRMGVKVEARSDMEAFNIFMDLYRQTAARQGFVPHKMIKEEFMIFGKANQLVLFLASYREKVLAASLIIYYGKQAVFHHSGTKISQVTAPASYLLQWEAIREAKRRAMACYNFWGVAPPDAPNHPWKGLSLFKTGFGGRYEFSIHAQDLPLSWRYLISYVIETFFRLRKGYR